MARLPLVLVHGYSDQGESFRTWRDLLARKGYSADDIRICNYQSLTNEVTIKDIAEGFDRALRTQANLANDEPFDAMVHSTGMLVMRSWLTTFAPRRGRLKHLVALAPATFGSPLAHKGRSLLGSVFKGNKQRGPDFLEAGDLVLDGLELGSRFTWDLAHKDVLCTRPMYGKGNDTPWVFIFCGTEGYKGLRSFISDPGTDGTVRWAGCALNTVKFSIDLSREAGGSDEIRQRITTSSAAADRALEIPFWPIAGKDHSSIVSDPGATLADLVARALQVDSEATYRAWTDLASSTTSAAAAKLDEWQQFVVQVHDERGDPVTDYYLEFFSVIGGRAVPFDFDFDVHAYERDKSLRCFHVNLTRLKQDYRQKHLQNLWIRIIASSGSQLVGYHGIGSEKISADFNSMNEDGLWDAQIRLPSVFGDDGRRFFHPFTTTFLEICLNRDPLPFGMVENRVCGFLRD
jgi:hypothetical protein